MKLTKPWLAGSVLTLLMIAGAAVASGPVFERVTGGALDLVWVPGFQTAQNMEPLTLGSGDPAYANPSGDHTVGVATIAAPALGSLIQTITDSQGVNNYTWQGWVFTGTANSRRGLAVRCGESPDSSTAYQFVIDEQLASLRFRRAQLVRQVPTVTTLRLWQVFAQPNFPVTNPNEWHRMKVVAQGDNFRCYWDDYELTGDAQGAVVDTAYATGWVGCYNFSVNNPGASAYFDDLELSVDGVVPTKSTTWGAVKSRWR